ncbi:hypothetical protein D9601_17405 [Sphingomonas sp. MA1305]|jgi:hypothetical protein|uniref:hypothetical protein n=1 Tax=Sphingomonas sp. MA1305 TaxID=2479204 RepID=UPI0018DF5A0E|nr:hypothetical protein [Sphingomonas sp. MA1305]MBI0477127.1 hypothetical protein [Sphingomonas sp. MA1305]
MPLWLDLLRTPMAAPETRALKRLRRSWQLLCLLTAATIGGYGPLHAWLGQRAAALALGLLVALVLHSGLYLVRKHRADTAFLLRIGEGA